MRVSFVMGMASMAGCTIMAALVEDMHGFGVGGGYMLEATGISLLSNIRYHMVFNLFTDSSFHYLDTWSGLDNYRFAKPIGTEIQFLTR